MATKTLEQLCGEALARESARPAVEYEGRIYTWGQMRGLADQLRLLLTMSIADPAAPVVFMPRNLPSSLATLLALVASSRSIRMIYAFQSPAAIAQNIARLNPAVVIAEEKDFSADVRNVLTADGIAGIALADMTAIAVPGCEHAKLVAVNTMAPRTIEILTSGTTGTPKQFPISFALIEKFMVGNLAAGDVVDFSGEPPTLLYFPLANITGIYSTLPPLLRGQQVVLLDRFSLEKWRDYVVRCKPAASGIPPAAMQMLMDANIPVEDLASLKSMGMGAAPLDPTLHRAFEQRYGIPILLSYGATEFGGPVTAMTADLHARYGNEKFGSVGLPIIGAQLRVVDPQTAEPLPAGREGVLEVISPRIGTHWIRTSDVAVIDTDGFLFLRGRADGAIMRGGFKILPETIEKALLTHPAVSVAAVVAVADKRVTEVPGAAIVVRSGCERPTVDELEAHLRSQLLATHIPAHWQFVDDLPKTPSFKIDRPAVKRLFAE